MKSCLTIIMTLLLAAPAAAQDRLLLLSPHWQAIQEEFGNAFKAHWRNLTGREVDLLWLDVGGGGSDIFAYISAQYSVKPEGIGVDILFGGGVDPFVALRSRGLLESYKLPDEQLALIPPTINGVPLYDAEDHTWYSATMAGFGIIYNRVVLRELGLPDPKTWADLADPVFYPWVGSADPRQSGSAHMAFEIILQAYGWEAGWPVITAMAANTRNFTAGAGQVPKDVSSGENAAGLAIDFYAWAQVQLFGEDVIGYVLPEDLTVVNGDAIAILKGAPNIEVAKEFIKFVMSEPAQKLFMLSPSDPEGPVRYEFGKFTVMPHLYDELAGRTPVAINPFEWQSGFIYDPAVGSARAQIVDDLIGTFMVDSHRQLQTAWRDALKTHTPEEAARMLCIIPITEEQAHEWGLSGRWQDPAFKNRTLAQWSTLAREKYAVPRRLDLAWMANLPPLIALALVAWTVRSIRRRNRRAPRA